MGKTDGTVPRYWHFLLYLFIGLTTFELILGPVDSIYPIYSQAVGYMGLLVEATLPLPQIFANARMRSCKGFRVSVVAFWLLGDAMKMFWFFTSPSEIPWAFKLCGVFQAGCDAFLGLQYVMYGSGDAAPKPPAPKMASRPAGHRSPVASRTPSGLGLANGRRTPITTEKKF